MFVYDDGRILENVVHFKKEGLLFIAACCFACTLGFGFGAILSICGAFWEIPCMLCVLFFLINTIPTVIFYKIAKNCFDRAYLKYEITGEGLILKYPFEAVQVIPWYVFQDMCIYYDPQPEVLRKGIRDRAGWLALIVLAHPEATKGWYYQRWAPCSPLHYRDTLAFDYTRELHNEFIEKCPRQLIDRRNDREYRISR